MMKAMTTIEFCEKSMKKSSYDTSVYDRGPYGNVKAVLGENPLFWLIPLCPPEGDGLSFTTEETPLALCKDMEAGRSIRRQMHEEQARKKSNGAGTGETADSED